jgi:hypothetical protein
VNIRLSVLKPAPCAASPLAAGAILEGAGQGRGFFAVKGLTRASRGCLGTYLHVARVQIWAPPPFDACQGSVRPDWVVNGCRWMLSVCAAGWVAGPVRMHCPGAVLGSGLGGRGGGVAGCHPVCMGTPCALVPACC